MRKYHSEGSQVLNPLSDNFYGTVSSMKVRTSVTFTDITPCVQQGLGRGEVVRKSFLHDPGKERMSGVFTRAGYCSSCPFQQPSG